MLLEKPLVDIRVLDDRSTPLKLALCLAVATCLSFIDFLWLKPGISERVMNWIMLGTHWVGSSVATSIPFEQDPFQLNLLFTCHFWSFETSKTFRTIGAYTWVISLLFTRGGTYRDLPHLGVTRGLCGFNNEHMAGISHSRSILKNMP